MGGEKEGGKGEGRGSMAWDGEGKQRGIMQLYHFKSANVFFFHRR
jgi:hypothetical protein